MVKNFVEPARPQVTIWRIQIAYWVPKAKNTQSDYLMPPGFPLKQWLQERTSVLRYTHIAWLVTR